MLVSRQRNTEREAELWFAVAERAWDEGDHDVARRLLDRAAEAAPWDDDEIMAAIEEKHADFSASAAERRRALISAGARRPWPAGAGPPGLRSRHQRSGRRRGRRARPGVGPVALGRRCFGDRAPAALP